MAPKTPKVEATQDKLSELYAELIELNKKRGREDPFDKKVEERAAYLNSAVREIEHVMATTKS